MGKIVLPDISREKIKWYLLPRIDEKVQENVDRESLNSLYSVSIVIMLFELMTMFLFIITRDEFDQRAWISIGSAGFVVVTCLVMFLCTRAMKKRQKVIHKDVAAFKVFFALLMSSWAIWVSWRHYNQDDQLLTFFIVELMIVCFIPFKPWLSTLITLVVYGSLYSVLYSVDQASAVNKFNFLMLVLVSVAGMIVRYHSQVRLAEKSELLQKKNDELVYLSRHDALTGLRNRMALNEDASLLTGERIRVFMIDIDYFKEFNDAYGHLAGDEVLREVAAQIRTLYPESFCYRYGGDEFLVIGAADDLYEGDTFRFAMPDLGGHEILLSIGGTSGEAGDQDQLFKLISDADISLYQVKRRTHSPECGGHERRHDS